jgi:hypothetical protein
MPGPADPDQRRLALLIAAADYQDPGLRGLRSPGRDASALAIILGDRRIGGFDVQTLVDALPRGAGRHRGVLLRTAAG